MGGKVTRLPRSRRQIAEKLPEHLTGGAKAPSFPPVSLDSFLTMKVEAAHRLTFRAHIHELDEGAPKDRSLGQWNHILRSFWTAEA